jgi:hypothetical protein
MLHYFILISLFIFSSSTAIAQKDHPFLSPGDARDSFLTASMKSCKQTAGAAAVAEWGDIAVNKYCTCFSERTADALDSDELIFEIKNHAPSDPFKKQMDEIAAACNVKEGLIKKP